MNKREVLQSRRGGRAKESTSEEGLRFLYGKRDDEWASEIDEVGERNRRGGRAKESGEGRRASMEGVIQRDDE